MPSFEMSITIKACQECPHFETFKEGNPLVETRLAYWCNRREIDLYKPENIDGRCPYLENKTK